MSEDTTKESQVNETEELSDDDLEATAGGFLPNAEGAVNGFSGNGGNGGAGGNAGSAGIRASGT